MQTQLKLPLFATDKGPDHRLVHDSGRSRVLRYPGGEWWMHQSQADRATAQMAAVLPYQQAPPRLEHFCRDNWRRRSSPRPGAPFPLWENHSEVRHLQQRYFCLDPASWQGASQRAAALRQASQRAWPAFVCSGEVWSFAGGFLRPTVPWKQKRGSLTVRACV